MTQKRTVWCCKLGMGSAIASAILTSSQNIIFHYCIEVIFICYILSFDHYFVF